MKINKIGAVLSAAMFFLTACAGDQDEAAGQQMSVSNEVEETDIADRSDRIEEASYMEKYADIITEMPPEEITKKRDGVEYPEFQKYTYYSETAERDTPVNVLLPPDYTEDREYPVLYILHGFYDNEDWMARDIVGISTMLTNLYMDGDAEEMIIVLPYIFCSKDLPYCTGLDLQNCLCYDNFVNDLTTDLMPFIESSFSVAKGRENMAITGFSMGGREALFIGFSQPELFGYIGGVCPAPGLVPVEHSPMHPGQMSEADMRFSENSPYLLMISAAKNDEVVGDFPSTYHNILDENHTEHIWHVMNSTGHDHSSVTPHLYNFFRVVFHDEPG